MLRQSITPESADLLDAITTSEVTLYIGPISIGVKIDDARIAKEILSFYRGLPFTNNTRWPDFHIELKRRRLFLGRFRKQFQIYIGGRATFSRFDNNLAVPYFDSAINWSVQMGLLRYLVIHAAVVEKRGIGILLPAPSGAGKSTLTAALVAEGWRLLSDEVALISLNDGQVWPFPRPISLKNDSIELIAKRYPKLPDFTAFDGTPKGRVAYVHAPVEAVMAAGRPTTPQFAIFPRYVPRLEGQIRTRLDAADSFTRLVKQSQNYEKLLHRGFLILANLVERCNHFELHYSNLDSALKDIEQLVVGHLRGS